MREAAPARDFKEFPIQFNTSMVKALLAGRKTQTRRLVRWPKSFGGKQPHGERLDNLGDCISVTVYETGPRGKFSIVSCPYGGEGDRLWVREAFRLPRSMDDMTPSSCISGSNERLVASLTRYVADGGDFSALGRYRNARFMPRALSRILLDITAWPGIERLNAISDEDAVAEGIVEHPRSLGLGLWGLPEWGIGECAGTPREAYLKLFRDINGDAVAAENPWVWVSYFKLRAKITA